MYIGEATKKYREEKKLSLRQFGDKADISHSYIDMLEKPENYNKIAPTTDIQKKVAKAIGMDYLEFTQMLEEDQPVSFGEIEPNTTDPILLEIVARINNNPRAIRLLDVATKDLTRQKLIRLEKLYGFIEISQQKLKHLETLFEIIDMTPEKLEQLEQIIGIFAKSEKTKKE